MKKYTIRKFPIDENQGTGNYMEDIVNLVKVTIENIEKGVSLEIISITTTLIKEQLYLLVAFEIKT